MYCQSTQRASEYTEDHSDEYSQQIVIDASFGTEEGLKEVMKNGRITVNNPC
jgi:hypothetical protein